MCGIVGLVDPQLSSEEFSKRVTQMVRTLKHRGPDSSGVYTTGPVGLGHTRLSIIDLSKAGHQPMLSDDQRYAMVYNGEIYNYRELRRKLIQTGVSFRGHSDSEVVLNAYRIWGIDALSMLNGMFAFAIWDSQNNELLLAKDRFGIKPLYYFRTGHSLVFASEIKALLATNSVKKYLNPNALHEYMYYGNALGENTLFKGVKKVLAGHYIKYSSQILSSRPYWSPEDIKPSYDSFETATANVQMLLGEAVERHMVSDVPVGIFLSGGIDSSAITAFASRYYQGKISTYSVGFDFELEKNELPVARDTAKEFGTNHHEILISGTDLTDTIETLLYAHDEPFADAANIPLYLLCKELKGGQKVILQGDGGDEVFGGYSRYEVLSNHRVWKTAARIGRLVNHLTPRTLSYYRRLRFIQALSQKHPADLMALLMTTETKKESPISVLSENLVAELQKSNPFDRYELCNDLFGSLDPVQKMLFTDMSILLPDTFLEKVDKSTMANSIEVRVPMLDHELTKYVMSLPSKYKVKAGKKKWLLRESLRGIVPNRVLNARKSGFGVPYSYWLREPLYEFLRSVLLDSSSLSQCLFDREVIEKKILEHRSGERDNGFILWKALHLSLWIQRFSVRF